MKLILATVFTLMTSLSFAGDKYICTETNGDDYNPHKVILTQVGHAQMQEGKFYAFTLEVFKGNSSVPVLSTSVNVRIEDVVVRFTNTKENVSGTIFLDELDQAGVKFGKTHLRLSCN